MASASTSSAAGDSGSTLASKGSSYAAALVQLLFSYYSRAKSRIYDVLILSMTERWYRAVLTRLAPGSVVLDVGIGTAGALLRCRDVVESRDLRIVGIDIDGSYVDAGRASAAEAGLSDRITIDVVDIYDGREAVDELCRAVGAEADSAGNLVDAVYFSGSFSLLPDPVKALRLASGLVKKRGRRDHEYEGAAGRIYITQTYQKRTPFFLSYVKPLLKYATTIDFGRLVREDEVLRTFEESGLEVLEHGVVRGSVDNSLQAAYLSVLR